MIGNLSVKKTVGLFNLIILDLYYPREIGFDATFFLQFLRGDKKVRIIQLFTYSYYHSVSLEDMN